MARAGNSTRLARLVIGPPPDVSVSTAGAPSGAISREWAAPRWSAPPPQRESGHGGREMLWRGASGAPFVAALVNLRQSQLRMRSRGRRGRFEDVAARSTGRVSRWTPPRLGVAPSRGSLTSYQPAVPPSSRWRGLVVSQPWEPSPTKRSPSGPRTKRRHAACFETPNASPISVQLCPPARAARTCSTRAFSIRRDSRQSLLIDSSGRRSSTETYVTRRITRLPVLRQHVLTRPLYQGRRSNLHASRSNQPRSFTLHPPALEPPR